jgi:hypothetical protein
MNCLLNPLTNESPEFTNELSFTISGGPSSGYHTEHFVFRSFVSAPAETPSDPKNRFPWNMRMHFSGPLPSKCTPNSVQAVFTEPLRSKWSYSLKYVQHFDRKYERKVTVFRHPAVILNTVKCNSFTSSKPGLGSTQPPIQWVPRVFPRGKAAGDWSWPLTSN